MCFQFPGKLAKRYSNFFFFKEYVRTNNKNEKPAEKQQNWNKIFWLFENTFLKFSEFYQISHERKPNKNFTEERRKTMAMTATFQTNIFNFEFQFDKCFDRFNTFSYIRSESSLSIEYFVIFVTFFFPESQWWPFGLGSIR